MDSETVMMLEAEFEAAVVDLAHLYQWRCAGFRPARTKDGWRTPVKFDGKGWPDVVFVHAKRRLILFVEFKVGGNTMSPEQELWADTLRSAVRLTPDVRYHLWRPADADNIARTLSFGAVVAWNLGLDKRE